MAAGGDRREAQGRARSSLGLLIVLDPILAFLFSGGQLTVRLARAQVVSTSWAGSVIAPEFAALVLGLTLYTAAFIGEIVRGGILAVNRGQPEAARAIGLSGGQTLRLVVVPQAMRIIIPPLTNQYLNLVKNSLVRGRHRLSGPRSGLCGQRAEHRRPGGWNASP